MRVVAAALSVVLLVSSTLAGAQPYADDRPKTLPYIEGTLPPPQYHLEERARTGPIVAGAILTGLGAFFAIGLLAGGSKQTSKDDRLAYAALAVLLLDGPGIPLLVAGLASKKKVYVRDAPAVAWAAGPLLCRPPSPCAGLAFGGAF